VQLAEAASLPEDTRAALIDLGSELRVGLRNFYVITRYNRSALYAAAVADLAEALRAAPQSPGR
jgi:membrane-bound lytic murein transglycosylase B